MDVIIVFWERGWDLGNSLSFVVVNVINMCGKVLFFFSDMYEWEMMCLNGYIYDINKRL